MIHKNSLNHTQTLHGSAIFAYIFGSILLLGYIVDDDGSGPQALFFDQMRLRKNQEHSSSIVSILERNLGRNTLDT